MEGTLALLIPIIAIAGGIGSGMFHKWLKFKEKQMAVQTALTAEKSAQYAAHTERLEQRVRVLERIITDKGFDTAAQIEALRDIQLIEPSATVKAGETL